MTTRLLAALALAAALTGCAAIAPNDQTIPPTTPTGPVTSQGTITAQQSVFAAKGTYSVLLKSAAAYREMRPCSDTVKMPCHDPGILAQVQKADNVAAVALDAAESAVRTPQVGSTALERAVSTANSALAALSALVSNLVR
jgi:hypothetical protein